MQLLDDAAAAGSLAAPLRSNATADAIRAAETWLQGFAQRLAAAQAAAPVVPPTP